MPATVDDSRAPAAALDPPDPADRLLRLPFDQYQRYRSAVDVLSDLGVEGPILEVGGAPGFLEDFLPGRDIIVTDITGKHAGRYVMADGSRLPFPDGTFAATVSLDVLEHVPPDRRAPLLAEARRVSSDVVVLCAPFRDAEVELAEGALHAFVKHRFGTVFTTLQEHHDNGLPDLAETVERLGGDGWATASLPSGYLPRWLVIMLVHHELAAVGMPELPELHAWYNATVSPLDFRSPSYRHVIVAARQRPVAEIEAAVGRLAAGGNEEAGRAVLGAIASAVLSNRLQTLSTDVEKERLRAYVADLEGQREAMRAEMAAIERSRSHFEAKAADLERQVADRDGHIVELRLIVDQLREERDDAQRRVVEALEDTGVAGALARLGARLRRDVGGA